MEEADQYPDVTWARTYAEAWTNLVDGNAERFAAFEDGASLYPEFGTSDAAEVAQQKYDAMMATSAGDWLRAIRANRKP